MDMYVRFVDSVVTRLGFERFHIAGNSFGGHLAWEYTLAHPDKVVAQVLLDAAGYPRQVPPPLAFRLAAMPLVNQLFTQITPYSIVEKSCKEVYYDDALVTPQLVQRYFDMTLRQGNRRAFVERIPYLAPKNHTRVKEISAPTMIQWGRHDKWIPTATVEEFLRDLPHAVVKMYDCGHVPMEEVASQSAADARAFLLANSDAVPDTLSPEADGSLE
jgi:pimeloyl-ACP methyl ester carboxylesterase